MIVDSADDRLLGTVGVHVRRPHDQTAEIGYWLAAEARGRGAMTRAVRLVADWAFAALGLWRLEILVHPDNPGSQGVAERAGFTREGLLRSYRQRKGVREDYILFSLLRDDPGLAGQDREPASAVSARSAAVSSASSSPPRD